VIVIYTPAGGEPEQYDAKRLTCGEAEVIERVTELEWSAVRDGLTVQSPRALRAVAWAYRKRAEPTLRYGDFDPGVGEVKARYDAREVADIATEIESAPRATEEQRDQARRELTRFALDPAAAEAAIKEAQGPKGDPPPAVSPSAGLATGL